MPITTDPKTIRYIQVMGKYLGYPKCCTAAFIELCGAYGNPKGAQVSDKTGFIPCPTCAERVLSKETTLEKLIVNRIHPNKFPDRLPILKNL